MPKNRTAALQHKLQTILRRECESQNSTHPYVFADQKRQCEMFACDRERQHPPFLLLTHFMVAA